MVYWCVACTAGGANSTARTYYGGVARPRQDWYFLSCFAVCRRCGACDSVVFITTEGPSRLFFEVVFAPADDEFVDTFCCLTALFDRAHFYGEDLTAFIASRKSAAMQFPPGFKGCVTVFNDGSTLLPSVPPDATRLSDGSCMPGPDARVDGLLEDSLVRHINSALLDFCLFVSQALCPTSVLQVL